MESTVESPKPKKEVFLEGVDAHIINHWIFQTEAACGNLFHSSTTKSMIKKETTRDAHFPVNKQ